MLLLRVGYYLRHVSTIQSMLSQSYKVTTGNSGFAERIGLCRVPFVGPSAELICAERRRRDRLTHGTTIVADGRTVGTARPSARRSLCRGLALGT
jgi:hypothetical protein